VTGIELPDGQYFNCPVDLHPDAGGQTRAMLMRNRIFTRECGIAPTILTFNPVTDLEERREKLLERGLLLEEISTRNIYAHYRQSGWGPPPADGRTAAPVEDLGDRLVQEETFPDGSPWRKTYRISDKGRVHEYLRVDGTPYLRIPSFVFGQPPTWPQSILQIDEREMVVGEFTSLGQWFRRWIRELADDRRSFVFIDSRHSSHHIIPMRAPHIHLVYVLHNIHVAKPRHWSSEQSVMYRRLMPRVGGMNALVTLTQRQQDDIAERLGRTTNMFVVPNPVDPPSLPTPPPVRDQFQVTVVARLEPQKRLTHAVAAFAGVLEQVPQARLDIFGEGSQRARLEEEIRSHGIEHAVTLRGHDPKARDALWTSSVFMMTSSFEGYPLSTLESMSHGCPVVSYDIKYGPREQITDGVDGFIVADMDIAAMTDRVVKLLRSPELVSQMSQAARDKALLHSPLRFAQDWQRVLRNVVDLKPRRTHIDEAVFQLTRLRVASRRRRIRQQLPASVVTAPIRLRPSDELELAGRLSVRGHSQQSDLASAVVTLTAVEHGSGLALALPVQVTHKDNVFTVRSRFPVSRLRDGVEDLDGVRLRLRLVWENSSWETFVGHRGPSSGVEVGSAVDGTVMFNVH
jgi:poly(glycerol-phosphate) alpha-glucosyltransferase